MSRGSFYGNAGKSRILWTFDSPLQTDVAVSFPFIFSHISFNYDVFGM